MLATTLVMSACASGGGGGASTSSTITVGSILDQTGPLDIYGKEMQAATKLAIKDINGHGGVLGKKLNLLSYDAQSDNSLYTQDANTLANQDHVAVVMGGVSSASREAVRPVVDLAKTLYFYNEQYEGGVCDQNTFLTGVVPSQQLAALIPYAIQHFGKRLYIVAADYNYGHISATWVQKYAHQYGGSVVNTEFIPLTSTDFSSVINHIQAARPDVIVSLLVGGNHISFYRQFYSAGLNASIHIVSPTFGLGNEQVILPYTEDKGIVVAYPYFQELSNPANAAFVTLWNKTYGASYPYISDSAVAVWNGWHLWAAAVKKAGSTDRAKVIAALQSQPGVSVDSPSGTVTMNGASHHVTQDVSIAQTDSSRGFTILSTQTAVPPSYENQVCNLIKNPSTDKQFTP
ncbi:MAG: urea ABC transporter substrate-binding protein [Streptosporangiaceae bacterium]